VSQPPEAGEAVLEARQVTKLFGGLRAVDQVSFAVRPGEILGIAGPNGAGKTTLFDTITGHQMVTSGEIMLGGESLRAANVHQRCRRGVARTFQHPVAADTLTALENARLAAGANRAAGRRRPPRANLAAGMAALQATGLDGHASALASSLSVYEKKRLMIATALATGPRVLLLDEPIGGLSAQEIDDTIALIRRIRDTGIAIVCIEHVMRALVALADRVLVLHHGAELFIGTPQQMLRDTQVMEVYLGSGAGRTP
jgi:branched-chain amino acid transport system ATP-binding protein